MALDLLGIDDPSTTEGQLAITTKTIVRRIGGTYSYSKDSCTLIAGLIWRNQFGLTPQQVCAALGTSAVTLLTAAGGMSLVLNTLKANTINLDPPLTANGKTQTIVPNQDGSVTIVIGD